MDREFIEKLIFCLIFIFAFSSLSAGSAFAATRKEKYEKLIEEAEKVPEKPPEEKILRPVVKYQAEAQRDPFQEEYLTKKGPAVGGKVYEDASAIVNAMKVQGIIWGGRFPQAIIDNKVVKVGDTIGEARIIEIKKEGITVFIRDRNYNISSPAAGDVQPDNDKKGGQ